MSTLDFEKNPLNRPAFTHDVWDDGDARTMTWAEWHEMFTRLEQALAQRLRVYTGPVLEGDEG